MAQTTVVCTIQMTNFGRHRPDQTEVTFEVPSTATVAEAIQLFRQNGASHWLKDYDLCRQIGIRLPCHSPPSARGRGAPLSDVYRSDEKRPKVPPEDLEKNAVACGLHSGSWTFGQLPPGARD